MSFILTVILIVILSLCIWTGFKKGVIRGIAAIIALVLALAGANTFASRIAPELTSALSPFVGGYIDSDTTTNEVLAKIGYGETELSLSDILTQDSSLRYDYAYECIRSVGFYRAVSEDLASDAVEYSARMGVTVTEAVTAVLCNSIAYVGCVTVAFCMLLILLMAIVDILNLDFHLRSGNSVDEVGGAATGLVRGFTYCVLICWLLGFLGIVIGKDTCEKNALISFFQAFRFFTRSLL